MTDPWLLAILRGKWIESLLAVTAVVVVSWPLNELVSTRPWTMPLVGVLVLLVVVGSAVRTARSPRWLVLLAQVLALLSGLAWWAQAQRPAGESALVAMNALLVEGVETIQGYAVPAPATPGLTFIILAATALLALLVEALGVTLRAAGIAGIPLLLVSAAAASGSGQALDPRYFLLGAAAWLVLLAQQGRSVIEQWRAAGASSVTTTVDDSAAARSSHLRLGLTTRVMGVTALVLAVVVPALLPHLPPTMLLDGRSNEDVGSVSFTETLDLAQDLADRSNAPVIRYDTDDRSPPPLRVTVSSEYSGGQWHPAEHPWTAPLTGEDIWSLNSLLAQGHGLETTTSTLTVTRNGMRAPQLALPHPTTSADLGQTDWQWAPLADVALVESAPSSYEVSYLKMGPLSSLPDGIGQPAERLLDHHSVTESEEDDAGARYLMSEDGQMLETVHADGARDQVMTDGTYRRVDPDGTERRVLDPAEAVDLTAVDPAAAGRVEALAAEVAGDLTDQVDIAMAIQRYLRSPEFTYSLTLADPVIGPDDEPLDPVSHFLETKQGYCTQFATAMVMMARAHDIPARLAVGFLPGSRGLDGTRTVVAADAHAWPELFINGLGWTRFEPTPASRSGVAPLYPTSDSGAEAPEPEEEPAVAEPTPDAAVPDAATAQGHQEQAGWFERNATVLGWSALGAALAAAVLSVVPLAGWWRRRRLRQLRAGDATHIEGEWSVLISALTDLGVPAPPAATPRALQEHYLRAIGPDPVTRDALVRATDRLESARYAAQSPPLGTMARDVRQVLEWRRRRVSRGLRLRAALLPASGRAQLRSLLPGGAARAEPAAAHPGY